ncbi:hypothetical protein JQ615_01095 [Bradyrhizobium jicamae]|uniref:Uncharacterized protein n=1 Tax=Bradyrhizobium jicamae TaxID=280332 RepID=A0ABS5FB72_9BRAD|nr:hypothetical protein [Bradyrhizobium jicamae]MBR0793977.1 hypothetical protein [Bradyrhizobium jicamae]
MSYQYANLRGRVVPFTGSFTLSLDDNGKLFRCDDSNNVVVTVPGFLHDGFNVGFIVYGAGTVTLAANPLRANNLSGKTALSTQYQAGSVLVTKAINDADAFGSIEFLTGGDFA